MNFGVQDPGSQVLLSVLYIWSLIWKGIALWRAAKQGQKYWFIPLFLLNTASILELIYLFKFSKKKMTIEEIKHWFQKTFTKKEKQQ